MTRLQVIKFMQRNVTLYSGVMTIGQLLHHGVTTEWDPGLGWEIQRQQGYQRAPLPRHIRGISEFLRREGTPLLPTNALLATRNSEYGELKFTPVDGDLGYLEIPESRHLFIVDYQHRFKGFMRAITDLGQKDLCDVTIPVTILSDASLIEEMKQFYLINNKQKRVDTDLALTLMNALAADSTEEELANLVGPGNKYRIRATRLVIKIAQLNSGPWADKIQEPNVPPTAIQTATIKSFVDSLRPIISIRSPIHKYSDDRILDIVMAIWDGVLDLWPEWRASSDQHIIQAAIGLFVMHRVASGLLIPTMLSSGNYSAGSVTAMLSPLKGEFMCQNFWRVGGPARVYSSGSGHKELAENIIDLALSKVSPNP